MRCPLFFVGAFLFASWASAAEPAKTIAVYVTPYYFASQSANKRPVVAVAKAYDALLAEGSEASLRKVATAIQLDSGRITPMTLMVLAIRFYDAGLRDDSVFWFYAAKGRYMTASRVVDFSNAQLADARDAVVSFATLAGPDINGYAFCDVSRQQTIRAKAVEWVASHPYEVVLNPAIPALPGDRQKNLELAIGEMRKQAQDETASLKDPATLKSLSEACAARQQGRAD